MLTRSKLLRITLVAFISILLAGSVLPGIANALHEVLPLYGDNGSFVQMNSTPLSPNNAYSSVRTCGGCHDYEEYERHSYHMQLAANDQYGWNPMNPDGDAWESGPSPKGKNWVQGQGHVGAW